MAKVNMVDHPFYKKALQAVKVYVMNNKMELLFSSKQNTINRIVEDFRKNVKSLSSDNEKILRDDIDNIIISIMGVDYH